MVKTNSDMMIAHVKDWMDSGMSIRDYARKVGITKGKFGYLVSKVKALDATLHSPKFIDLNSVKDSTKSSNILSDKPKTPVPPQMTLTFPSGMVLKIYN